MTIPAGAESEFGGDDREIALEDLKPWQKLGMMHRTDPMDEAAGSEIAGSRDA